MKIDYQVTGLDTAIATMERFARQARIAVQRTLNDGAFAARSAEVDEIRQVFTAPTPFIQRAPFVDAASRANLKAELYLRYPGGKAVEPEKVLAAEVFGGQRRQKRAEVALTRIGILPPGYGLVPAAGAPKDSYGNVPGAFFVRVLAYFQAFGEQGYKANMTAEGRAKLARRGLTKKGHVTIRGQEFFVSYGPSAYRGRRQHLAAGIWRRSGIHGHSIVPVFLFVPLPTYSKRLDFFRVAEQNFARQVAVSFPLRLQEELARV